MLWKVSMMLVWASGCWGQIRRSHSHGAHDKLLRPVAEAFKIKMYLVKVALEVTVGKQDIYSGNVYTWQWHFLLYPAEPDWRASYSESHSLFLSGQWHRVGLETAHSVQGWGRRPFQSQPHNLLFLSNHLNTSLDRHIEIITHWERIIQGVLFRRGGVGVRFKSSNTVDRSWKLWKTSHKLLNGSLSTGACRRLSLDVLIMERRHLWIVNSSSDYISYYYISLWTKSS